MKIVKKSVIPFKLFRIFEIFKSFDESVDNTEDLFARYSDDDVGENDEMNESPQESPQYALHTKIAKP